MTLDDLSQGTERVGHARRGLVVGNEHGGDLRLVAEQGVQVLRVRRLAPGQGHPGDVRAECLGQIGKAITKGADRDREHALARRDDVADGALQAAGAARRKDQHVVLGLEGPAQTGFQLGKERPELGATVVDHRGRHCPLYAIGNGGRSGNPQLGGLNHAP